MQTIYNIFERILYIACYILTISNILKNYYALDIDMQLHTLSLKYIKFQVQHRGSNAKTISYLLQTMIFNN
jgi:hypothetical protein